MDDGCVPWFRVPPTYEDLCWSNPDKMTPSETIALEFELFSNGPESNQIDNDRWKGPFGSRSEPGFQLPTRRSMRSNRSNLPSHTIWSTPTNIRHILRIGFPIITIDRVYTVLWVGSYTNTHKRASEPPIDIDI